MNIWKAMVLGIVQGFSEFLPISSSGHLVIAQSMLGVPDIGLAFDTFLHLGSLLAVLYFFRSDIFPLIQGGFALIGRAIGLQKNPVGAHERLAGLILIATIPAVVAGFLLEPVFERLFTSTRLVGFALWVTAGLMWWAHRSRPAKALASQMPWSRALAIGMAQAVAIIPGISRSGSTLFAGVKLGLARTEAARFSFLMSIPVILGAAVSQTRSIFETSGPPVAMVLVGMACAAISGFIAIKALMAFVERRGLVAFAIYCAAAGALVIAFL